MNPVFSEYGLKDLLPLKLDIPDEGCTRPNRSMYCFEAGESLNTATLYYNNSLTINFHSDIIPAVQ